MATEQYQIGYESGYSDGFDEGARRAQPSQPLELGDHTELIKQLRALGIPNWVMARELMSQAADALAAANKKAGTV